ncbi:Nn.00g079880.m01.CDS01 [Neocucurbitaria sp. VM-36]
MADRTPKTMSSRLMTMKFMQRSAAKSVASSPSTPNGPPSKKARLSNGRSAPGTPDHEILQSALLAEEKKRQEALDKAAQYTGETKWVLSYTDPLDGKRQDTLRVRQAGFAEIDAGDDSEEEEEESKPIRMQFGGGVKKKADKPVPFEKAEDSQGEIESSSEDYDSDDPTAALIRETKREVAAERRESRKARTSTNNDSPRGPPKPHNEDMNHGGLSSGGRKPAGRGMSNVECYICGQKGHVRDMCPKRNTPRGSAGRGRGRGRGRG